MSCFVMEVNVKNRINKNAALIRLIVGLLIVLASQSVCRSDDINISLNFPQKSSARMGGAKSLSASIEVSGTITLSVTPYPNVKELSQCKVEYYLDKGLLYETEGVFVAGLESLRFKYDFDTRKFEHGRYSLYVNYFDKQGASAIGSQRLMINNKQEN